MGERRGPFGALAPRHAFRLCGRAGGVEHHRPGFGIGARNCIRSAAAGERGKCDLGWLFRIECDPRQILRQRRTGHRRGGGVFIGDRFGFGIAEIEIDLACAGAPIHRRDDDARELAGPMQRRRLPAVLQRRDQVIARLQPDRVEARDHRRDAPIPLRIGQAHLAIDDGKRVRIAGNAAEKAEA